MHNTAASVHPGLIDLLIFLLWCVSPKRDPVASYDAPGFMDRGFALPPNRYPQGTNGIYSYMNVMQWDDNYFLLAPSTSIQVTSSKLQSLKWLQDIHFNGPSWCGEWGLFPFCRVGTPTLGLFLFCFRPPLCWDLLYRENIAIGSTRMGTNPLLFSRPFLQALVGLDRGHGSVLWLGLGCCDSIQLRVGVSNGAQTLSYVLSYVSVAVGGVFQTDFP